MLEQTGLGLVGEADMISHKGIVELKFTQELSPAHVSQLLMYGLLDPARQTKQLVLFNIRNGELRTYHMSDAAY